MTKVMSFYLNPVKSMLYGQTHLHPSHHNLAACHNYTFGGTLTVTVLDKVLIEVDALLIIRETPIVF